MLETKKGVQQPSVGNRAMEKGGDSLLLTHILPYRRPLSTGREAKVQKAVPPLSGRNMFGRQKKAKASLCTNGSVSDKVTESNRVGEKAEPSCERDTPPIQKKKGVCRNDRCKKGGESSVEKSGGVGDVDNKALDGGGKKVRQPHCPGRGGGGRGGSFIRLCPGRQRLFRGTMISCRRKNWGESRSRPANWL